MSSKSLREPIFDAFFSFIHLEYDNLFVRSNREKVSSFSGSSDDALIDRMTQANVLDSESLKLYRRTAYSSLSSYLDLFRRADSLKQVPKIGDFQALLKDFLSSTDNKLQKCALECLTKSGYCKGLLTKYKKLLEGFADDEKFKDMIPIMIHGSNSGPSVGETTEGQDGGEFEKEKETKAKRKETKSAIPKLEDEDRAQMLPIVIKLLQSKLQQQRGAINKRNLYSRRSLVF